MENNSVGMGISSAALSWSIRSLAYIAIYNHDRNIVKKNANSVKSLSEFSVAQKDFDRLEKIAKVFVPAFIGITTLCVGLANLQTSGGLVISTLTFGASHLIEAGISNKLLNKKF
jgi:hypothetical protein